MKGQSHSDPKTWEFQVLKTVVEDKKTSSESKINNNMTAFWGGRKKADAWMKKCHFIHVLCPFVRAVKKENCASHKHLD